MMENQNSFGALLQADAPDLPLWNRLSIKYGGEVSPLLQLLCKYYSSWPVREMISCCTPGVSTTKYAL